MDHDNIYKITQGRLQGFIVMVYGTMQESTHIKNITDRVTLRDQLVVNYFSDLILNANDYRLENAYDLALEGKEHKFPNYPELEGTIYYALHRADPLLLHESWVTKKLATKEKSKKNKK
jgi:hypothetical protein